MSQAKNSNDTEISTPELFFGLVGPIGVDLDIVQKALVNALSEVGYTTHELHVTELMNYVKTGLTVDNSSFFNKYKSLINIGDKICELANDSAALAALCVAEIRRLRHEIVDGDDSKPALKHAFVIRQFKRPEEIELMRQTYGRKFVQLSISTSEDGRRQNLINKINEFNDKIVSKEECETEAINLMKIDFDEGDKDFGQKMSKVFHLGDFFIDGFDKVGIPETVRRFVKAFFGFNGASPTKMEYGMYTATAASLRSIDLSRQVGASIFTREGEVLALGCNEVPKPFGGTYWTEASSAANRDFEKGFDANHSRKREILYDLIDRLGKNGFLSDSLMGKEDASSRLEEVLCVKDICDSQVMDIIEFGRMIHAEMSAITDAARMGVSIRGSTMYCTTFPCHMCAKHIVSSGIRELVYLEPYPKSYASDLHKDSISFDITDREKSVIFRPFIGISPRRYQDIFKKKTRKDSDGKTIEWLYGGPAPMVEDKSSSYLENEDWALSSLPPTETISQKDIPPN